MSYKYVIKNCEQIHSSDNFCWSKNVFCQDCTYCLLKQIVELCKKIIFLNGSTDFTDVDMYKHAVGENFVARQILKLLDIQEVERDV